MIAVGAVHFLTSFICGVNLNEFSASIISQLQNKSRRRAPGLEPRADGVRGRGYSSELGRGQGIFAQAALDGEGGDAERIYRPVLVSGAAALVRGLVEGVAARRGEVLGPGTPPRGGAKPR